MIIDAHAHIMPDVRGQTGNGPTHSLDYGKIQWGKQVIRLHPPMPGKTAFPPEILLENMDWAGVDKAVLLQGSFYGGLNDYVAQAVKQWPDRFIGAGFIDPRAPDAQMTLRQCVEEFGFHVIKFELSVATGLVGLYPDLKIDSTEMAWIWEEAERQGLVVTLDLGACGSASYQTTAVRNILARHPTLKVVIAHLGQPPINNADVPRLVQLWQEQIQLARHPNVWFDLAALPGYAASTEDYPYPTACEYIRRAVELIGPDKLLWGTDAPGLLSAATYPQLLAFVSRHCEFLSAHELRRVLGINANRIYGTELSDDG